MHSFLMQLDMPWWVGTRKKKKRVPFSGEKGIGNWGEWDIESDWEEREGL